jgi:hypothetical protein
MPRHPQRVPGHASLLKLGWCRGAHSRRLHRYISLVILCLNGITVLGSRSYRVVDILCFQAQPGQRQRLWIVAAKDSITRDGQGTLRRLPGDLNFGRIQSRCRGGRGHKWGSRVAGNGVHRSRRQRHISGYIVRQNCIPVRSEACNAHILIVGLACGPDLGAIPEDRVTGQRCPWTDSTSE